MSSQYSLHPSLLLLGLSATDIILFKKSLIAPFVMLHVVSGINCLYLLVNLILVLVPPFLTHLFLHPSLLPLLIHHSSITPSLFLSQVKIYLFHKSYPRNFTSSSQTAFTDLPGPFLLSYFLFLL